MKQPGTNKTVLIVDDERGLREGCRRALVRSNYEVDTAPTGQEGLVKTLSKDFDLILLDVRLPDIGGIELLQHIRSHNPDAVCIIMTAYATVDTAVQAMKLGAYDFIEKPFSDDTLLLTVERGMDKRQLQQELAYGQRKEGESGEPGRDRATLEDLELARSASMRKVAHELRAPIAAIRSFMTLILQGYTTPEKTREWQQRAAERADDLLRLIDDVLNLARLQDPRFEVTPEVVSVEGILRDVLGLHTPEAEGKGIRLKVETRPCGTIVADAVHIKQLWTNLISNAIKYTPQGGQVTIRLYQERQVIVGVVKDTGIGITKEDMPRLFEDFYRTEQAKAFAQHGTGLGLSIVWQIVHQYGGEITVESQLGKGSQFTFRLPMSGGR
jgi:two-component system, sensor histidine kinase and response regulator